MAFRKQTPSLFTENFLEKKLLSKLRKKLHED